MYRRLQLIRVASVFNVMRAALLLGFLVNHASVAIAEEQPGFMTAEQLINFYSPTEPSSAGQTQDEDIGVDVTKTRSMETDADGIRGLGGVRKSKASEATSQQAEQTNAQPQPARRQSFLNILFGINSVNLKQESYRQLDEIGKALGVIMEKHASANFVVEGHTDSMGSEARNEILSVNRAEAIRKYLIGRFGFDESRITSIGYGERSPVATNDTEAGRMLNRRVEIVGK